MPVSVGATTRLSFAGTDGSLEFQRAEDAAFFCRVAHRWPLVAPESGEAPQASRPCLIELSASGNGNWTLRSRHPNTATQTLNPVNGVCALAVELIWSRLRTAPEMPCLHAAGVEVAGHLIAFPAARRAGKSTLAAHLAHRGHQVFSDDVLPIAITPDGRACGVGTGIAPRLRLPVPVGASADFQTWVSADPGPKNRQYKYLLDAPIAPFGATTPIAAIVVLDRRDEPVEAAFSRVSAEAAMPLLIKQNFGRFAHSAQVLETLGALARDLPCLRLTYQDGEAAARAVEDAVRDGTISVPPSSKAGPTARAPSFDMQKMREPFVSTGFFRQTPGYAQIDIAGESYVADAAGAGIFRLNPTLAAIWRLLEEQISAAEITETLSNTFPEVPENQIESDVTAALEHLWQAGLIAAV